MSETNIFELLIDDPVELKLVTMKSDLMILLTSYINDNSLTQKEAAKLMGITQPRVSSLVNDDIEKFSIDKLIEMALKLGFEMNSNLNVSCSKENPYSFSLDKKK
ncbi:helix-turn-helix domain-containing protein [Photobacterium leiognathi]|uniref:helix-turn-helix domain-containing protein n=1 Tax=Photobacterium leiognathi TaxID=553611 RepID=UPI00273972B5|nr:XRE family transcriptional regulator [Photobacterium leiognathi]